MPQDTSIGVSTETKRRLETYRDDSHANWDEVFESITNVLPSQEEINENGCSQCGGKPHAEGPIDHIGGLVQWYAHEYEGNMITGSEWFCSDTCYQDRKNEIETMVPTHPDQVLVGGYAHPRIELDETRFYLDGDIKEVSVDLPLYLDGYEGEPIYVVNEGKTRFSGVVDDVETFDRQHTSIIMGMSVPVEMYCHPNEDRRESWLDNRDTETVKCPRCGDEFESVISSPIEHCLTCGEEI